jgi:hypothetical protein
VLVAGALTWADDADLRGDQQAYNLLVGRILDPGLLARDALYHHDPARLHVPWFLQLHAAAARRLGGDVATALAWLTWPMGAVYLVSHYALFRALTAHRTAAALAALGSLAARNALGGDFWGFDGVRSAATRTIVAALVPLLLLLFAAWRRRRDFPLFYLLLGALFNVHPVSAYHLAQATAVAHVALERARPRAIVQVLGGIALFVLGGLPYLVPFLSARDRVDDPATLALARAALDYRFDYLFYPIAANALLSVLLHASLPLAAWLLWRRRAPARLRASLDAVAVSALVLALGGTAVIQALGVWSDRPYLDIQQLRMARLAYPVLLGGLALGYTALLERRTPAALVGVALLFAASLVPPHEVIHALSDERRAAVKAWLGVEPGLGTATRGGRGRREAVAAWAAATTPPDALFFADDFEFRVRSRRAITGSFKDGALFFLIGDGAMADWFLRQREVEGCRAVRGRECWFALARRLDADYVLVDPALSEAGTPADFEKVFEGDGWTAWRRRRLAA